jgi:hypothetical protein
MRIDSAGNVGIGMTPGTKLDVQGDITARGASISSAAYINMGTAYTAAYLEWVPGSSQLTIMNSQAGPLRFATNNGERMRITSGGDVGIGTNNPAVKLEVAGQIRTEAPTGGTAANWRLGTVHTVSPTSPNRTIEVDIGGTIYYLHAKTTNN